MHVRNTSPTLISQTDVYSILKVTFNLALAAFSVPFYTSALPAAKEPEWKSSKNPIWPQGIPEFYGTLDFPVEAYTDISRRFPKIRGIYIDSMNPECVTKSVGSAEGWICKIDKNNKTSTYYLKSTDKDSYMRLNEIVNLQYASSLGVKVPNVGYMVHLDKIFIASEKVPGFETADQLFKKSRKAKKHQQQGLAVDIPYFQHEFTKLLQEKLNFEGFVQLTAFKTIMTDLTNASNWGYDQDGNLILIDIDQAPKELARFFFEAARGIDYKHGLISGSRDSKMFANFDLSLDVIVQLKQFFIKMHQTAFPELFNVLSKNKQNGFTTNLYLVLPAYIAACNEAIEIIGNLTPEALAKTSPNTILARCILKRQNNELSMLNFRELAKPTPFEAKNYPNSIAVLPEEDIEPELDAESELQMRKYLDEQNDISFAIHRPLASDLHSQLKEPLKQFLVSPSKNKVTKHVSSDDRHLLLWMAVMGTSGGLLLLALCKQLNIGCKLNLAKNQLFFHPQKNRKNNETPMTLNRSHKNINRV